MHSGKPYLTTVVIHIMAGTTPLSQEKRPSILTLRNEGQSIRKMSRTLNVSSSAVAKTNERYDETGSHEEPPENGRARVTSAAEDKYIRVTSLTNRTLKHLRLEPT